LPATIRPSNVVALLAVLLLPTACSGSSRPPPAATTAPSTTVGRPATASIRLTSPAFRDGARMPRRYTCQGDEVSPPLTWRGVPAGVAELALVVEDTTGGQTIHWVVLHIAPSLHGIAEGAVPPGAQQVHPYFGPCPPAGRDLYRFTVYALPQPVRFTPDPDSPNPDRAAAHLVEASATAFGSITATYQKR
jgi:Raf kinase inhibitor-like YbhB/YbcL family protein